MPVSTMAKQGPIGAGASRAVALGGGGEWFIAWMLGRGSTVHVDIANPDPTTDFMDAATIGPAIADGIARGKADVSALAPLW